MSGDEGLRALAEAATAIRRELPEDCGGPHAEYSPLFIENAFARHAPGDERDPDLRRIWRADGEFYSAANPTAVLALLDRLAAAEAAVERVRALADDLQRRWDEGQAGDDPVQRFVTCETAANRITAALEGR